MLNYISRTSTYDWKEEETFVVIVTTETLAVAVELCCDSPLQTTEF